MQATSDIREITGDILHIVHHNETNGYVILSVETRLGHISAKGNLFGLNEHMKYTFYGSFKKETSGKYKGRTNFVFDNFEIHFPIDLHRILCLFEEYNVRASLKTIYKKLGENCLDKIYKNPNILDDIEEISKEDKGFIIEHVQNAMNLPKLAKYTEVFGLAVYYSQKIYKKYKYKSIEKIQENPYRLLYDFPELEFHQIDNGAKQLQIKINPHYRAMGAIIYVVNHITRNEGSTWVHYRIVAQEVCRIIPHMTMDYFIKIVKFLKKKKRLFADFDRMTTWELNEAEIYISKTVTSLMNQKEEITPSIRQKIKEIIDINEKSNGYDYAEKQKEAAYSFVESGIMILTGGPGTGKTTSSKLLIDTYRKLYPGNIVSLLAPTGKAALRMTELTGLHASTIHRFLKWDGDEFFFNENYPNYTDLLVIDEFSMVSTYLLDALLRGTVGIDKILIIGDFNQLESIGPGRLLDDLIKSEINCVQLTEIFRQKHGEDCGIIEISMDIIKERYSGSSFAKYPDTEYIPTNSISMEVNLLDKLKELELKGYDNRSLQLLCPMYAGEMGIDNLNRLTRGFYNPDGFADEYWQFNKIQYRIGDKVLQLKNKPDHNISNGDIGYIKDFTMIPGEGRRMVVDFERPELVFFKKEDLKDLTLGYCISVHKSQGSEFPAVLMVVSDNHSKRLLNRRLVYTGLSRAKQLFVLMGNEGAFKYAVDNKRTELRNTFLKERISERK